MKTLLVIDGGLFEADFSLVPKIRKAWEECNHLEAFNFLSRAEEK